jgi:hypothetical protein
VTAEKLGSSRSIDASPIFDSRRKSATAATRGVNAEPFRYEFGADRDVSSTRQFDRRAVRGSASVKGPSFSSAMESLAEA